MSARVQEAVSVVLAAKKIETLLLDWAERLSEEERYQVRNSLASRSDQQALDIWGNALDVIDGRRDRRG